MHPSVACLLGDLFSGTVSKPSVHVYKPHGAIKDNSTLEDLYGNGEIFQNSGRRGTYILAQPKIHHVEVCMSVSQTGQVPASLAPSNTNNSSHRQ